MNILDVIKKNINIRKIFGERELVIIEKQLLGVILKPSEKTRLSRDIRKKFEAINSLMQFSEYFKLKHGMIINERINDAKEVIIESKYFPKIKKIILFGSAAEHKLVLRSDIDIAVEFTDITKEDAMAFRLHILGRANEKIDIQVYNILPDKIKKEIDLKGKVLYERKDQR
ncbi:MAG: nucleotidyltransferase domain-containing protein [Nanoarchaeota archaeon]|nr:nucleotidyltransferase domain-containing protein [Nanoarchaeota archaeon]MBU0962298.1 nucleotidyltransferase domain-containing protein [Nanoarchaeota archaeon]